MAACLAAMSLTSRVICILHLCCMRVWFRRYHALWVQKPFLLKASCEARLRLVTGWHDTVAKI